MTDFADKEEREGVRWNWIKYPGTKGHAESMVIPLSMLLTPLKAIDSPQIQQEPVLCKSCRAVANPHCRIDMVSRLWVCPFCLTRNSLPPELCGSQGSVPTQLQFSVVDYKLNKPSGDRPVFFYCVDTSITSDELEALKDSLVQSLCLLPEDAYVGLVTFGTMVTVWELGFGELHKSYVLMGSKEYSTTDVRELLSLPATSTTGLPSTGQVANPGVSRFIVPLSECELTLTSIIEDLSPDPWPTKPDTRPLRCTGAAMEISLSLLQLSGHNGGGRLLVFSGGAVTKGPGAIASVELKEHIRQHVELAADLAPFYESASKFYRSIADRLVQRGFACDIFAGCLDQTGLTEMASCVTCTGGACLMVDSFKHNVFKQSFHRLFNTTKEGLLNMAFNATLEIQCSRGTKVSGLIGPCTSLNKMSPSVSETEEVGIGKTCAWQMSTLTNSTTFGVYFDVCGSDDQEGSQRYVQAILSYQHISGEHRIRVGTFSNIIAPNADQSQYCDSGAFDQDAAAVLVARAAVDFMEKNSGSVPKAMRWVDRTVIGLVQRFGTYQPGDPSSLRLSQTFSLFPVFMYHLRRSQFLQVFNNSPDETTFYRASLNRDTCFNDILMIQPTLHSYTFNAPPCAVLLDSTSIHPEHILLLDTFFDVVIHFGSTIAAWVEQKFQERPEYDYFKQLLLAPRADAERLMADRFPCPRYTECNQHGSQARILYNRINPSVSYQSQNPYGNQSGGGEVVLTDDASLQTFMGHLKKLAVSAT